MRKYLATYEDIVNGEATPEEYRLAEECRQERVEARAEERAMRRYERGLE